MSQQSRHVGHDVSEARSALTLRAVLAAFGLVVGLGGTAVLGALFLGDSSVVEYVVGAILCLVVAVSAAVDLAVIRHRMRQRTSQA